MFKYPVDWDRKFGFRVGTKLLLNRSFKGPINLIPGLVQFAKLILWDFFVGIFWFFSSFCSFYLSKELSHGRILQQMCIQDVIKKCTGKGFIFLKAVVARYFKVAWIACKLPIWYRYLESSFFCLVMTWCAFYWKLYFLNGIKLIRTTLWIMNCLFWVFIQS